jgi:hypothetical protein
MSYGFGDPLSNGQGTAVTDYIDIDYDGRSSQFSYVFAIRKTGQVSGSFTRLLDNIAGGTRTFFLDIAGAALGTGKPGANIGRATSATFATDGTFRTLGTGGWYWVIMTYDGLSTANKPIFYTAPFAGSVTKQANPTQSGSSGAMDNTPGLMRVGNRGSAALDRPYEGYLAELSIWEDYVLSDAEVANIVAGRSPMDPTYFDQSKLSYYNRLKDNAIPVKGGTSSTVAGAVLYAAENPGVDDPPVGDADLLPVDGLHAHTADHVLLGYFDPSVTMPLHPTRVQDIKTLIRM